jgi:hypothetical protein
MLNLFNFTLLLSQDAEKWNDKIKWFKNLLIIRTGYDLGANYIFIKLDSMAIYKVNNFD